MTDNVECKNCGTVVPLRWWLTWSRQTPCPNCNQTRWGRRSGRAFVYAAVVLLGIIWHVSHVEWFPPNAPREMIDMVDFHIYYEAARGNDTWMEDGFARFMNPAYAQGWLYPSWTRAFWWWTLPFTFNEAKWIWLFCITLSASELTYRLLQQKGGALVALLIAKTYFWQVETGNADFILALLALSPIAVVLGSCIKYPLVGVFAFHAFKSKALRKVLGYGSPSA